MKTQVSTTPIISIYNLIILDESGSMSSIYEQALGGANATSSQSDKTDFC